MTPETNARLNALLAPYTGRMTREDAIRGILESGPLKAVCPHCGMMDCITATTGRSIKRCDGRWQAHREAREDYLTDEAEVGDERSAWWKALAWAYQSVYDATVKELEALQAGCKGDEPCAGELAYQAERKRARKWKRRASRIRRYAIQVETERDKARADLNAARTEWDSIDRERTELRAALDALRARVRHLRVRLLRYAQRTEYGDLTQIGRMIAETAGEPIS